MEKPLLKRTTGVALFTIIEFFEQFSYYGLRGALMVFLVSDGHVAEEDYLLISYTSLLGLILALPFVMGILTDLFFKQTRAMVVGGLFSLLGYLLLFVDQNTYLLGAALILVFLGSSLVRPNTIVLLGRLYEKYDNRRAIGFLTFSQMSNLAAFLSTWLTIYVAETYGRGLGVALLAGATLLYWLIFLYFKNRFPYAAEFVAKPDFADNNILDAKIESKERGKPIFFVLLVLFLWGVFLKYNNAYSEYWVASRESAIPQQVFHMAIPILLLLALLIYWRKKTLKHEPLYLAYAFLWLSAGIILFQVFDSMKDGLPLILPIAFMFFSEVLIRPFALSYITRMSDAKYASTIAGLYYLSPLLVSLLMGFFVTDLFDYAWVGMGIIIVCCLLLFIFKDKFLTVGK